MTKNFYRLFYIILISLVSLSVSAQRFSTSTIQSQDFPRVKTNFVAKSNANQFYTDLQNTDFEILEYVNGVEYDRTASAQVSCTPSQEKPEVNILLIIDASDSMDNIVEGTGQTRFFYVKEAVKSFIDQIEIVGRTHISTLVFGFNGIVNSPWTQDKDALKDSLENIVFQSSTRYLPPINASTDPGSASAKVLFDDRPDDMPNIVIFLTDGKPSDSGVIEDVIEGSNITYGEQAIRDMIEKNVVFYSVAIFNNVDKFLTSMSNRTNGNTFKIDAPEKITEVYNLLALEIQNSQVCELSWDSPYSCDDADRNRRVELTLLRNGVTSRSNYDPGEQSIAQIETSSNELFFGNPNLGPANSVLRTISYTPKNLDVFVESIRTQPNTYYTVEDIRVDGQPATPPFLLDIDSELEVDILFTQQGERIYRQSDVVINSRYCMPNVTLYGGIDKVILTSPNENDIFSLCGPVEINWTGVTPESDIEISYSIDNEQTWELIEPAASGLSYSWNHPFIEDQTDVKVKLFKKATESYLWANNIGGNGNDTLTSLAVTEDETTILTSGAFRGTINRSNFNATSRGEKDILVTSLNSGGDINWMRAGGSPLNDEATGITEFVDDIFVVGYGHNDFTFGNQSTAALQPNKHYLFLSRMGKAGIVKEQYMLGNNGSSAGFEIKGEGIRVQGNIIEVYALYRGSYIAKLMNSQYRAIDFPEALNWSGVTITFELDINNQLRIINIAFGNRNPALFSRDEVITDNTNVTYNIGTFTNERDFDSYTVTSSGLTDGYVTAYGESPSSEDISDAFDVLRPVMEFDIANRPVDFTVIPLLSSDSEYFPSAIVNNSSLPITIDTFYLQPETEVFKIISGLSLDDLPILLPAGESIDLEIEFSPNDSRSYNSTLIVESTCAESINLQITGRGECVLFAENTVVLNDYNVGSEDINTVTGIFTNENGGVIDVTPRIDNPEFTIKSITTQIGEVLYDGVGALGSISVPAGATLDMEIGFLPTELGERTGVITFETPSFCEDLTSNLSANGINAELVVDNLDFEIRRISTVNTGEIRVRNLSTGNVNIEAMSLENGSVYQFNSPVNIPYTMAGGEELTIDIVFSPVAEETYNDALLIRQGNGETVRANLTGIGSNPTLDASFTCPENPEVNTPYEIEVALTNTSIIESTDIESIAFDFGGDYRLLNASGGNVVNQLNGLEIPTNSTINIYVEFTPSSVSPAPDVLNFVADVAIGNGADEVVASTEAIPVNFNCGANDDQEPFDITFNTLACYTFATSVPVDNQNGQPMVIRNDDVVITGSGSNVISLISTDDLVTVPSNTSQFAYPIFINADTEGIYTATVDLSNNSLNAQRIYNITVNAGVITIDTEEERYEEEPGTQSDIVLNAIIPPLDHTIDELNFDIEFNPNVIDIETPISNLPDWDFNVQRNSVNNFIEVLSFSSTAVPNVIPVAGTQQIATLPSTFLLGSAGGSNMIFNVVRQDCDANSPTEGAFITTARVCNEDSLRTVVSSSIENNVSSVYPNPVSNQINIEVTASWDMVGSISLVNTNGEVVGVPFSGIFVEGRNEIVMDVSKYSSGIYQLVLTTPHNRHTQQIVLTK